MKDAYVNLLGAIIRQAIEDLSLKDTTAAKRQYKSSAEAFLSGKSLDFYCELCGLDANYIRSKISKNTALLTKPVSKNV